MGALAMSLMAAGTASADDTAKSRTSGLAVGAGLGYHVPFLGAELQYHQAIAPRWWLVPYAGVGIVATDGPSLTGVAGGIMGAWGVRHRIIVDASVGVEDAIGFRSALTGHIVEVHPIYGAVAGAGYQFLADGGFWISATLGAAYFFDDPAEGNSRWAPTLNVTAGYKIW
jgi:hypothetical protein